MKDLRKRVVDPCTDPASRARPAGLRPGSRVCDRLEATQPSPGSKVVLTLNDGLDELFGTLIETLDEVSGKTRGRRIVLQ